MGGASASLYFFGYIMDNNKVPLILLSGGLDSSFLLQEKLKEGDVEVLYITGLLGEDKMHEEKERRERIIKILEKDTSNRVRKRHTVDLGVIPFGDMADGALSQPSMWMFGALMVSDANRHSELCIGYVLGDHISSNLGHVTNAWTALQSFSKRSGNVEVTFPLMYHAKDDILRLIHPEVMRHIWYCEAPRKNIKTINVETIPEALGVEYTRIRPCGKCGSCLTMGSALYRWNKYHGTPYWKYLRKQLGINTRRNKDNETLDQTELPESENVTVSDLIEIMDKHDGRPASSNS